MSSTLERDLTSAHKISLSAQSTLAPHNPLLSFALTNSAAKGLPEIDVGPAQGSLLSILCQLTHAQKILEIGTLGGYSTLWFSTSSPTAHVTSLEINPKHRDVALENIKHAGEEGKVDIILGDALETLPKLHEKGEVFDFVFVDASWGEQAAFFDWAVKLTRKGGCVYVDNAVGPIIRSEVEGKKNGGWELIEAIGKDERVQATFTPVLQTHHEDLRQVIDGYILAIVK